MSRSPSAIAIIVVLCCAGASPAYAMDGGRYGAVKIVESQNQARGFVIFFSDRNGITPMTLPPKRLQKPGRWWWK